MTPYRVYKHEACKDLAMVPLKSFYVKEKKVWKLKVRWILVKSFGQRDMLLTERIEIPESALAKWKYLGPPEIFIRT